MLCSWLLNEVVQESLELLTLPLERKEGGLPSVRSFQSFCKKPTSHWPDSVTWPCPPGGEAGCIGCGLDEQVAVRATFPTSVSPSPSPCFLLDLSFQTQGPPLESGASATVKEKMPAEGIWEQLGTRRGIKRKGGGL